MHFPPPLSRSIPGAVGVVRARRVLGGDVAADCRPEPQRLEALLGPPLLAAGVVEHLIRASAGSRRG